MENLAFRSLLRWKMIIPPILITLLLYTFHLNGWENMLFTDLWSEGVKHQTWTVHFHFQIYGVHCCHHQLPIHQRNPPLQNTWNKSIECCELTLEVVISDRLVLSQTYSHVRRLGSTPFSSPCSRVEFTDRPTHFEMSHLKLVLIYMFSFSGSRLEGRGGRKKGKLWIRTTFWQDTTIKPHARED